MIKRVFGEIEGAGSVLDKSQGARSTGQSEDVMLSYGLCGMDMNELKGRSERHRGRVLRKFD